MDTELKCNRLTCRRPLTDKAVVTTCSHIFCVDCATELFNASKLCPACETCLSESDDVVLSTLHPTNDYKTSVLSGLSPSLILDICSRAVAFWQYQIHQEMAFQQAVVRNLNEKNAQLQKQLDNVIREANGEISLLTNKTAELERDLELERRKVRDLQESSKERDKEHQKLKAQHEKIKRKALLVPNFASVSPTESPTFGAVDDSNKLRNFGTSMTNTVDLGAVVGGMEANGIQRTPIMNRTVAAGSFTRKRIGSGEGWQPQPRPPQPQPQNLSRCQRPPMVGDYSYRSASDRSDSASEIENILVRNQPRRVNTGTGWTTSTNVLRPNNVAQRSIVVPSTRRTSGTFRPSIPTGR